MKKASIIIALLIGIAGALLLLPINLAWDDSDYLRNGLALSNGWAADWASRPLHALGTPLRVRPKPPLLVWWIAAASSIVPSRSPAVLHLLGAIAPFTLLLWAVDRVARGLFGDRSSWPAILVALGSPMMLHFGSKVMVESLMALTVMLSFYFAAKVLGRPSRLGATCLGAAVALAMLTKLTVALFLPVPMIWFGSAWYRRHGLKREHLVLVAHAGLALLLIAGPWYAKNLGAAVRFARFSARYNEVALGSSETIGTASRLIGFARDVAGFGTIPVACLALAAFVWRLREHGPGDRDGGTRAADFATLSGLGAGSGALILLGPAYFDPRFLAPIWASLAVCIAGPLANAFPGKARTRMIVVGALLAVAVGDSARRLVAEPRTTTYWDARGLIDHLVDRYGVANIDNLGNCRDWNVSKTGLINELRANPRDCFVLHDLSADDPATFGRRIADAQAVVALDRSKIPADWFAYGPGLNRNLDDGVAFLRRSPEFERVEVDPAADLPPLLIFVRKDRPVRAPIAPRR